MTQAKKVAIVAAVGLVAIGMLALLVLRPWWNEVAPPIAQAPVGLVGLALGLSLFLWLRQTPKSARTRRPMRRRRLRDRYERRPAEPNEGE